MAMKISDNNRTFLKDGKHFFYLADTCWSAFTNITMEEWEYYLNLRKMQGFNVLQINILPQWDASGTDLKHYPLPTKGDGVFEFSQFNMDYFERSKKMCEMAKNMGFELALVVLWCNYVPGTWASRMNNSNIMPYDFIDKYVKVVHETFSELDPMYIISGDTDFDTEETINYYLKAQRMLKKLAPNCIQTLHIKGRLDEIPEVFIEGMDFYMYQSGHNAQNMGMPYILAESLYKKYPAKPLLNSEPCYEQMGYSRNMYGRFYRYDVRRAAWLSILSGASAGVTYGAHGIYSWHKINKRFGLGIGEGFDAPNPWNDAVKYPGAWDYGYIKDFLDTYNVDELIPLEGILKDTKDIKMATTKDENKVFIYLPVNTTVRINKDFSGYSIKVIDLVEKNICYPHNSIENGITTINMHNFEQDALIVLTKW